MSKFFCPSTKQMKNTENCPKRFHPKVSPGHVECNFDNFAETFRPKDWKYFSQNEKKSKMFKLWAQRISEGLSELHSTCPRQHLEGRHIFWKKIGFSYFFRVLGKKAAKKTSKLHCTCSQPLYEKWFVSLFIFGLYVGVFRNVDKEYRWVCGNCMLYVWRKLLTWIFLEGKFLSKTFFGARQETFRAFSDALFW